MDGDPCGGNLEIATTEVVRFFVSCLFCSLPSSSSEDFNFSTPTQKQIRP